jgi:hypothetical protein
MKVSVVWRLMLVSSQEGRFSNPMDAALVRVLLQSIIDSDASQFDASDYREAVHWLEERIWLTPRDKGSRPQYQPHVESAARAAQQAVTSYERGDMASAKPYAEEALKNLEG